MEEGNVVSLPWAFGQGGPLHISTNNMLVAQVCLTLAIRAQENHVNV
jgi:hypothetical protein